MLRMIVGPPHFIEWNSPWHDIQHHWNGKAVALAQQHGIEHLVWAMPQTSLEICDACCKFYPRTGGSSEYYFGIRLVQRTRGYPRHGWTSKFVAYTRFRQWGDWYNLAQDSALWMQLSDDFVKFCSTRWRFLVSHCLRPKEGCLRTCRRKVKVKVLQRRLRWEDRWSWKWMTSSLERRTSRRWKTQRNFRGGHLGSCQWWQALWENKFSITPWSSRMSWRGQSTHFVTHLLGRTARYVKKLCSTVHFTGKLRSGGVLSMDVAGPMVPAYDMGGKQSRWLLVGVLTWRVPKGTTRMKPEETSSQESLWGGLDQEESTLRRQQEMTTWKRSCRSYCEAGQRTSEKDSSTSRSWSTMVAMGSSLFRRAQQASTVGQGSQLSELHARGEREEEDLEKEAERKDFDMSSWRVDGRRRTSERKRGDSKSGEGGSRAVATSGGGWPRDCSPRSEDLCKAWGRW